MNTYRHSSSCFHFAPGSTRSAARRTVTKSCGGGQIVGAVCPFSLFENCCKLPPSGEEAAWCRGLVARLAYAAAHGQHVGACSGQSGYRSLRSMAKMSVSVPGIGRRVREDRELAAILDRISTPCPADYDRFQKTHSLTSPALEPAGIGGRSGGCRTAERGRWRRRAGATFRRRVRFPPVPRGTAPIPLDR